MWWIFLYVFVNIKKSSFLYRLVSRPTQLPFTNINMLVAQDLELTSTDMFIPYLIQSNKIKYSPIQRGIPKYTLKCIKSKILNIPLKT